jgi:thiol-disulfide isomerase/thioredoxin
VAMSTKALIGVLLAGTVGVVIFFYVHFSNDTSTGISVGAKSASACSKAEGNCLPDMSYIAVDGRAFTPQTLNGKVVVVNFWATWCHPCQKEIPDLSRVYSRFKDRGLVLLGVMTDNPGDGELLNFRSDYDMSYPVVRGSFDIVQAFHEPSALPTTFIFNKRGKEVYSHVGPLDEGELSRLVEKFLAEAV